MKICLLWAVWLSMTSATKSPQPDSQYQHLDSYYDAGQIKIGDLFETPKGLMMIAVENNQLIVIPNGRRLIPFIQLVTVYLPTPSKAQITTGRKVGPAPGFKFDYQKAVAMAKKLQHKVLPHSSQHCNKAHWQNYILYGVTHESRKMSCPLARSLDGVSPQTILSDRFSLKDATGKFYYLQTPEEYNESLKNKRNEIRDDEYVDCGCGRWFSGRKTSIPHFNIP